MSYQHRPCFTILQWARFFLAQLSPLISAFSFNSFSVQLSPSICSLHSFDKDELGFQRNFLLQGWFIWCGLKMDDLSPPPVVPNTNAMLPPTNRVREIFSIPTLPKSSGQINNCPKHEG